MEMIGKAIEVDPAEWRYHCALGQICISIDKLDEAVAAYRRAADLRPKAVEVHFGLGVALSGQGPTKAGDSRLPAGDRTSAR